MHHDLVVADGGFAIALVILDILAVVEPGCGERRMCFDDGRRGGFGFGEAKLGEQVEERNVR